GRDELAGAVWGEEQPEAWDSALSALASRIRSGLRQIATVEPALDIERGIGRYALATPAVVFVDHERARAALPRAALAFPPLHLSGTWTEARVALQISVRGVLRAG